MQNLVKEVWESIKTDDIGLKVRYMLSNVDAFEFWQVPVKMLEIMGEFSGVEFQRFGERSFQIVTDSITFQGRIDPTRPSVNDLPRKIPQIVVISSWFNK